MQPTTLKYPDPSPATTRKPSATTNKPITTARTTPKTTQRTTERSTPRTTRVTPSTTTTTESNIDNELENQSSEENFDNLNKPDIPSVPESGEEIGLEPFEMNDVRCSEDSDYVPSRDCTKVSLMKFHK